VSRTSESPAQARLRELLKTPVADLARHHLRDLLDIVRAALDADTAAVLIREPGSEELVAREACGLEEEVRQGVRVPLGAGFAGRIAAQGRPVMLTRVDASTVTNPILWQKGIRAMLGVPLVHRGQVLGVLHVGRLHEEPFGPTDSDVLLGAADRLAEVLEVRRLTDEAAAAAMLERGLLPARLPRVPGVEFAARYVPAESLAIGGDWYDAFIAPSGDLWLVTGDVAGHGLNAAVVMGRVKSALRAYALLGDDPARVLELTDRKVQHFEMGSMVTVVCAVAKPPYDRVRICSAGHLPPALAAPGRGAELLDLPLGPPMGVLPDVPRDYRTVALPAGALLLLYTDGLVERRADTIDRGLQQLCSVLHAEDAESVCRTVMQRLVGNMVVRDDIAVLAVRRT
jgi:sigma-B regulation protein RsbU (phosphoserine phosphatase)